jgi:outer membrane protein assembly factor BamD
MDFKIFRKIIILKIVLLALLLPLIFSGCSYFNIFSKSEKPKASPEVLYSQASAEVKDGHYKKAQESFLKLKEEYPLHELAILAEVGIADSLYNDKEYAEAENAYSGFVSLHPTNEKIPYALYQMGMCHYNEIGDIDRDQTETIKAKKEWEKLIARYPESKFSSMAEKLIQECKQKLAEKEFYVGRFYFRQEKYQAALSRFETVAKDYANIGLDYEIEYYINETKIKIAEEEKLKLKKEAEKKKKEAEKEKKMTNKSSYGSFIWSEDSDSD